MHQRNRVIEGLLGVFVLVYMSIMFLKNVFIPAWPPFSTNSLIVGVWPK